MFELHEVKFQLKLLNSENIIITNSLKKKVYTFKFEKLKYINNNNDFDIKFNIKLKFI